MADPTNGLITLTVDGVAYQIPENASPEQIQAIVADQKPAGKPGQLAVKGPGDKNVGFNLPGGLSAETARGMMSTLLNGGALAASALPPELSIPINTLLGGFSGALDGGLTTHETGWEGAKHGAAENMILGGFGAAHGLVPKATNRIAYRLGGLGAEDSKSASKALEIVNEGKGGPLHPINRRIPVGAEAKTDRVLKGFGEDMNAAEAADPNMHDLPTSIGGSTQRLIQNAQKGPSPVTRVGDIAGETANQAGEFDKLLRGQHTAQMPSPVNISPNPPMGAGGKAPLVTTSHLRDVMRQFANSPNATAYKAAKSGKDMVTVGEQQLGQIYDAIAQRLRQVGYEAESHPLPPDEAPGPLQLADKKYAAGKQVQSANSAMRSPETLAEPGKIGARGGLGSGLGRNFGTLASGAAVGAGSGYATGGVPGAMIGGILGPVLFSPSGLSRSGYLLDDLLSLIEPAGQAKKTYDSATGANAADRQRAARRRSPK